MLTQEEIRIWDGYFSEQDPIEKVFLMDEIKKKGMDILEYIQERCSFCNEWFPLRKLQQVTVYEKRFSVKQQDRMEGCLTFRCHLCKQKKQKLVDEFHDVKRQIAKCLNDVGVIVDFGKYELAYEMMEILRKKMQKYDVTLDGLMLSSIDNTVDLITPLEMETIARRARQESITSFLDEEKRRSFLKWSGKRR